MAATLDEARRIHLIGIGGCSMSGLARILLAQGHVVTGSDREHTPFTDNVEQDGIRVFYGHKGEHVAGADAVIYSAAIKPDNPERVFAREHSIPEIERSVALGQLSERFHNVVAIAGCHGKTTITSMLAFLNEESDLDATIHVGGFVELLNGGVRVGKSDLFITEACEYVESFLTLSPTIALINNIDNDHLDCYGDMDHIVNAFFRFCSLVPPEGKLLGCIDDAHVAKLLQVADRAYETYGLCRGNYHADEITYDTNGNPCFTLYDHGQRMGTVHLSVPGRHNVINAIAAYAVAKQLRVPFDRYQTAMRRFVNTQRRFELLGMKNGARIYHDYAHHPNEIAATLQAAKNVPHGKLYCVFQCNSFTRARTLFTESVTCFADADEVLVPNIYPGRETDTGIVHARDMVNAILAAGCCAKYIPTFEEIAAYLNTVVQEGDIVLTLGSGDVYRQSKLLLN